MPLEGVNTDTQVRDLADHGMKVNFSSIFAGSFILMALSLVSLVVGNAIGLGFDKMLDPTVGGGIKALSFIYNLIAVAASTYVGGYCTTQIAGIRQPRLGAIYGLATWALSGVLATAYFITQSAAFTGIIAGVSSNLVSWFSLCAMLATCFFSTSGGITGCMYSSNRLGIRLPERLRRAA